MVPPSEYRKEESLIREVEKLQRELKSNEQKISKLLDERKKKKLSY